jgi:hypothetical protein
VGSSLAASMDGGEILEEKSRAVNQRKQRSVMIGGKWVKASFYVGEVLPEKHGHVRVKASAIRHRRLGMSALPSGSTLASSGRHSKPAHREAVPDIPGDAW